MTAAKTHAPAPKQVPAVPKKAPANSNRKHEFKANDHVVYPTHGVGKVSGIEEQEVAGLRLELFIIDFEKDKMTLRVPTMKAKAVGMRKLSSPEVVGNALNTLKGRARIKRTMWSRRAQVRKKAWSNPGLSFSTECIADGHTGSAAGYCRSSICRGLESAISGRPLKLSTMPRNRIT